MTDLRTIAREAARKADTLKHASWADERDWLADAVAVETGQVWARYRPQHDEECASRECAHCGNPFEHRSGLVRFATCACFPPLQDKRPKPCTCGLDDLLSALTVEESK